MKQRILILAIALFFKAIFLAQTVTISGIPKNLHPKNTEKFNQISANKLLNELHLNGYLSASLDSIIRDTSKKEIIYQFDIGTHFNFSNLEFDSISYDAFNNAGMNEKLSNKNLTKDKLLKLIDDLLTFYENNGHPFCIIKISDSKLENKLITPIISIQKGPFIQIDSIIIKGNCKTNKSVIENTIAIHKNDFYSESKIKNIDKTIQTTPYLKLIKPTQIEFIQNKALVYVYIDDAKSSKLNGIIGVQPNENGKITFTGEVTAKLENALKKGEQINLKWDKINLLSQSLDVNFIYPYIVNSKFGTDLNFNLYKRDTSYLDLKFKTGVSYSFNPRNKLTGYYGGIQSILIASQPEINSSATVLDIKKNSYGLNLNISKTDYFYNPRKGFNFQIDASIGQKKLIKNPNLDSSYYNNLELNSIQWTGTLKLEYFIPIGKRSTVLLRSTNKTIHNKNIYFNELYRFGGNNLLRGFDEQSIFGSSLSINTLEYRLLIDINSYLFTFVDYGWYEQKLTTIYSNDTPYSFGGGISFETGPGIFTLQYALGTQMNNPILVKTGKIHFGFVNYF